MDDLVMYTPTWTTPPDCPPPLLANGTLQGWLGDDWAAIMLEVGSVTSFGTGPWRFSCPIPDTEGMGVLVDQSLSTHWPATGIVRDGVLSLLVDADRSPATATHPFLWQARDALRVIVGPIPEDFRWQTTPTLRP